MPISEGLRTSLNQIRETSIQNGTLYHKQIDEIAPDTDISALSTKLFSDDNLLNEFFNVLVKRIVYTQIVDYKLFNNPLKFLEGDKMPLGAIGQEIFINPAKGRKFNGNDFAGLLAKYEADIKVQYMHLNSDVQYPVTYTRAKIKNAFTSWTDLEAFIDGITQSLYNGCYIDRYNFTKGLVASAYRSNNVMIDVIDNPKSSKAKAEEFLTKAREYYLNMQEPSAKYNAWRKIGGYGRDVLTWTEPQDIVFLIRNDIGAYLDVNVLASAFNIDKAQLMGRVKYVADFNEYDVEGNIVVDGSNVLGIMCDKSWFRIKNQETTTEDFYNPNNRTLQIYLNDVNMYQYSLFANAIVFATKEPEVAITSLDFKAPEGITIVNTGDQEGLDITVTPYNANTPVLTYETDNAAVFTVEADAENNRHCTITATGAGSANLTARAGNITTSVVVNVEN